MREAAVCRFCAELELPEPDVRRRDLDALVVGDELERLLERHRARRDQSDELVGRGRARVRELPLLRRVDVEIACAGVLADDHSLVDLDPRPDEELPRSCRLRRERAGNAPPVRDEAAGRACPQLAVPGLVAVEDVVEDAGAAGLGQELGAEADERARGHEVLHPHPAGLVVDELPQAALAQRQQLRDHAHVLLGRVDREPLHGLVQLPVEVARDDLWLTDGQLETLPPHQLDEHRELQLSAPLHLPGVGTLGREHAQRHVPRAPGRGAPGSCSP